MTGRIIVHPGLPSGTGPEQQAWWDHWLDPDRVERGGFGHPPHESGWLYRCAGMPSLAGCGETVIVPRRWKRVGVKRCGWTVVYGASAPGVEDRSFVLAFCPSCTEVVNAQ